MGNLKILAFIAFSLFAFSCSKNIEKVEIIKTESMSVLSPKEINAQINQSLADKGDFNWNDASNQLLWSAVVHGDSLISVGYGDSFDNSLKSSANDQTRSAILDAVGIVADELKSGNDALYVENSEITVLDVKVNSYSELMAILALDNIRYVEPAGYNFSNYESSLKSSSGCTTTGNTINSSDYKIEYPNAMVSWNYYKHNIPQAWAYSKGKGITVGVIDTGVSSDVYEFGSGFSNSYSPSRYIRKYGTFVHSIWPWSTSTDGVYDKCGHGSRMAGVIAAPLNNKYRPVGVANGCNLVSYRATKNVVLDSYHEQNGVAKALIAMGNRSDVKIISMSIGHIFTINKIADAVKYANARGKLIFAAGGTSTSFTNGLDVIFPANMNETVAVTGIKDNGYNECNVCHKGSKIDFTVVMARSSNEDRVAVTLGYYKNDKSYVGGSSVATATTAGIAALVWARHPTWTKSQVLSKLKQSADLYPYKHSNFGYGCIDALAAVK